MQKRLFGFLKHVGSFAKLFGFHTLQNVNLIPFTYALKSPAIKDLWYLNVPVN